MDELYRMLKKKLDDMRTKGEPMVGFTFDEVARIYQLVCLMKQIKNIADWCDEGHS